MPKLPEPLPDLPHLHNDQLETQVYTHNSSTSSKESISWDRLACLGDTCLSSAITKILFDHEDLLNAGEITEIRKYYVSNANLAQWGRAYEFHTRVNVAKHMVLTDYSLRKFGGCAFQAYLGALAYTQGHETMTIFVGKLVEPGLEDIRSAVKKPISPVDKDVMGKLNDRLTKLEIALPEYKIEDLGDKVSPRFDVRCIIKGNVVSRASANNKREGQRAAANQALMKKDKELKELKVKSEDSYFVV